jgi:transcriptional regulator with XRE-family HTH domain
MSSIFERILKVRTSLNLNQKEFAEKLSISFRNLQNYETGKTENIPHTFIHSLYDVLHVNLYWLFTGLGQMFETIQIEEIPEKTKILFEEAIKTSEFNPYTLDEVLIKYILTNYLGKIKEINRSEGFWNQLILNRWQNIGYLRVLTRALIAAKEKYKSEVFSVNNAKIFLEKIIKDYEIRLFKDTINNVITEKTRQELLKWIDQELDNIACFVMLSDFDGAVAAIKETLDKVDQLTIKLN